MLFGLAVSAALAATSVWVADRSRRAVEAETVPGTPYYHPSIHTLMLDRSPGQRVYTSWHSSLGPSSLVDPATTPARARARFRAHRPIDGWRHILWGPGRRHYYRSIQINGWPWPAFWCDYDRDWTTGQIAARGGVTLSYDRVLPLRPMPLGLAADTLVFGAAAWALVRGPRWVRSTRRIRRGRCPACGYDLLGRFEGGCPECGWERVGERGEVRMPVVRTAALTLPRKATRPEGWRGRRYPTGRAGVPLTIRLCGWSVRSSGRWRRRFRRRGKHRLRRAEVGGTGPHSVLPHTVRFAVPFVRKHSKLEYITIY